jgi:WD repeat and SOF domain-containing protein 1
MGFIVWQRIRGGLGLLQVVVVMAVSFPHGFRFVDELMCYFAEVIVHSLSLRRPILKLPQAHKGMVSGLTFTSHKSDMHRQLLSCGSLDMTIKMWKVSSALTGHLSRTAIDMEEGEELDEFGRNAFADVGGKGRLDGMMDEDQARLDLDLDEEEGGFMEAEGGGLNLDEEKRQKAAERIEVSSCGL